MLGIDAETDPTIGKKLKRGIYGSDRIHSLVMGFPGCGKTRFLLSQIKQHIDHNEGFMVIDFHHSTPKQAFPESSTATLIHQTSNIPYNTHLNL